MVSEVKPLNGSPDLPEIVVEPAHGWFALELGDLWRYRELAALTMIITRFYLRTLA